MADVTVHDFNERYDRTDREAILELRKRGETIPAIARVMGRTTGGIRSFLYRMRKLGIHP